MKRVLFILAAIGYFIFLARAMFPSLDIYYDVADWLWMSACAGVAVVCASGVPRWLASLALLISLTGSIYGWNENRQIHARLAQNVQAHTRPELHPVVNK